MDDIFQEAGTVLAALLSQIDELDDDDLANVAIINRALFQGQHYAAQLELLAGPGETTGNVIHLHTDEND
ncbi:MAG: hypothetical protein GY927_19810 [bacterium]|nr:hypothetical protein [bacterium]